MKTLTILITLALLSGCASITRGSNDALVIETNPSGATCTLSTGEVCASTPCSLRLSRKSEGVATCTKGSLTGSGSWTHKTAGAGAAGMAGNVILGGLIGAAVDAGTGATQDLTPNPLVIELHEAEPASEDTSE